MIIRDVKESDAKEILSIYGEYIESNITFELALPSLEEFKERISAIAHNYPYLVLESEAGELLGYAYAHELRERLAYQWSVELSIYLSKGATGQGAGKVLYMELIERLRLMGIKNVFGCIALPNQASEKLHENLGFELVGHFKKAGYKNSEWVDVVWYQREIGIGSAPQTPQRYTQGVLCDPRLI